MVAAGSTSSRHDTAGGVRAAMARNLAKPKSCQERRVAHAQVLFDSRLRPSFSAVSFKINSTKTYLANIYPKTFSWRSEQLAYERVSLTSTALAFIAVIYKAETSSWRNSVLNPRTHTKQNRFDRLVVLIPKHFAKLTFPRPHEVGRISHLVNNP